MKTLSFAQARPLINESDVLLFRGKGLISRCIKHFTDSHYTHIGLASWVNGAGNSDSILEIVELKEFKGGRSTNLERMVKKYDARIDVLRPIPYFVSLKFNPETCEVELERKDFDGKLVTREMRRHSGRSYGYWTIFKILWNKLTGCSRTKMTQDNTDEPKILVCSSAVAYCFSKYGYDLVPNKGDGYNSPGDISRSTRLNYLFTLCNG